ncbi:hypothetical protein ALCH109712_02425 [Alkalicoccus chagannorensis]
MYGRLPPACRRSSRDSQHFKCSGPLSRGISQVSDFDQSSRTFDQAPRNSGQFAAIVTKCRQTPTMSPAPRLPAWFSSGVAGAGSRCRGAFRFRPRQPHIRPSATQLRTIRGDCDQVPPNFDHVTCSAPPARFSSGVRRSGKRYHGGFSVSTKAAACSTKCRATPDNSKTL